MTSGQTRTVNAAFTPQVPGQRMGEVNLVNSAGAVLATAFINVTGTAPQVVVTPGTIRLTFQWPTYYSRRPWVPMSRF